MISKELSKYLLTHYKKSLLMLGKLIDAHTLPSKSGDRAIVPYIISALEQISGEQCVVARPNEAILPSSYDDLQTGLLKLITNRHLESACKRYMNDSVALEAINDFNNYILQKPLVIFKDYNGNLRINFPSRAWCEAFKKELGIEQYPEDISPLVTDSNKKLCFKGRKNNYGQLRIPFPTSVLRDNFLTLLRHVPRALVATLSGEVFNITPGSHFKPVMALIENDPLAVYFNPNFYTDKFEVKVCASAEISLHEDSVRMDMLYATRMIAQGIRSSESLFKFFPRDPTNHIIHHATGGKGLHTEGMQTFQVDDMHFSTVIARHI